jgi:hypothetical protein
MPDFSFHLFDVAVRLTEEALFHPTPLYQVLDKVFGISKVDPFVQLGIYDQVKQATSAVTYPIIYSTQMTAPSFVPPPPTDKSLMFGGQLPSRQPDVKGRAQIFG